MSEYMEKIAAARDAILSRTQIDPQLALDLLNEQS